MNLLNFVNTGCRIAYEKTDYVPLVSAVVNIVNIFIKCVVLKPETIHGNHYFTHLENKSYSRCLILLVPVVGNILVYLSDRREEKLKARPPAPIVSVDGIPVITEEQAIDLVNQDGMALQNLPQFQDNYSVVLAAVINNGLALQFASSRLRANQEIREPAIQQISAALQYAIFNDALDRNAINNNNASQTNRQIIDEQVVAYDESSRVDIRNSFKEWRERVTTIQAIPDFTAKVQEFYALLREVEGLKRSPDFETAFPPEGRKVLLDEFVSTFLGVLDQSSDPEDLVWLTAFSEALNEKDPLNEQIDAAFFALPGLVKEKLAVGLEIPPGSLRFPFTEWKIRKGGYDLQKTRHTLEPILNTARQIESLREVVKKLES